MPKTRFLPFVIVLAMGCQSAGPGAEPAAPTPPPAEDMAMEEAGTTEASGSSSDLSPSTLDGVYTAEQAQRGYDVWESTCSECHDQDDWTDQAFLERWNEDSVYRFWYYIYESMPEGTPPYSLPREAVTDVVTYIFQLNGLPEGDSELGSDDDSIGEHWLVWWADDEALPAR